MPGPTRRCEGVWRRRGCVRIGGVDEAGRGCLAGPVVAAAVVLGRRVPPGIDDSKRLSRAQREGLFAALRASQAEIGLGSASVAEIESVNIRQASFLAMRRAIAALPLPPDVVLVDGFEIPDLALRQQALIGGDRRSLSIAAASICAKVVRDCRMRALAATCPGYGFETHVGYPTPQHLAALAQHGVTPHHRGTFGPVRRLLAEAHGTPLVPLPREMPSTDCPARVAPESPAR